MSKPSGPLVHQCPVGRGTGTGALAGKALTSPVDWPERLVVRRSNLACRD
ncbi:MAG: hypothetical protein ABSE77_04655 [Acidimicrobiales bacterium]